MGRGRCLGGGFCQGNGAPLRRMPALGRCLGFGKLGGPVFPTLAPLVFGSLETYCPDPTRSDFFFLKIFYYKIRTVRKKKLSGRSMNLLFLFEGVFDRFAPSSN